MTLQERVQSYLGNGGLFNPEFMEHDKVRDLVVDLRDENIELTKLVDRMAAELRLHHVQCEVLYDYSKHVSKTG